MTYTNLIPDGIIIIMINAQKIFTTFQLWANLWEESEDLIGYKVTLVSHWLDANLESAL